MVTRIHISEDFTDVPGPRFRHEGDFSGEQFRQDFLVPTLRIGEKTVIDLNDTEGYGSSFLEEAFGGLIREEHFSLSTLKALIELMSRDETWIAQIWSYVEEASIEADLDAPKVDVTVGG
ncbi:MAG: STAS-like domain-containing protein [Rhodospirillaceae bacterium]|jgi:hypothetical protein|nr:STAS-like domain-containing protein [Rhodospirillaceae bacterium]MBT7487949.1 STAS-like domain-containing protein [Rhodospirillales bacterium]MBT3809682.1 STAS-like domain-containing protein [Rhodospirillaceae bacterium]MBT4771456.1 STAS-like domain-containing protein [Rhodospirillaceae bacterium]MBT5356755.1 STAS-like domain-containing protein [Rhodospirillaceae bacterium]